MAKTKAQFISEHSGDDISFKLIDGFTVTRRLKEGDITLPAKKIDIPKDQRWNTKQMNSKLLRGLLNGDSVDKIADSLKDVIGNNEASAIRNARTMVTGAENAGRLDSYKSLEAQGVVQKKVWMATPDDRTRKSHIDVDGEEQDLNNQFSNGCMYPGDPAGPAEEVWNCRCSMRDHIIGFRGKSGKISYVEGDRGRTLHDDQMDRFKRIAADLATLKKVYNSSVKGLSGSDFESRFIDDDSYINGARYRKAFNSKVEALSEQDSIVREIDKLESDLSKMETAPKPREDWTVIDEAKSIMGQMPMIQSEESRLIEKEIDSLWKQHKGLTGVVGRSDRVVERMDQRNYESQIKNWSSTKPTASDNIESVVFSNKTGIKEFDNDLAKGVGYIAEMSPREYLDRCAYDIYHTTYESAILGTDPKSVMKYAQQMSRGAEFNMGYIDYTTLTQEGRQRAMAAELLGIKKIPVYIRGK